MDEIYKVNTAEFLRAHFAASPPSSFVSFMLLHPGRRPASHFVSVAELLKWAVPDKRLSEWLHFNARHASSVFFGIHPRRVRGDRDEHAAVAVALSLDLDGAEVPVQAQKGMVLRTDSVLPVSAVVESGTPEHVHIYYALRPTPEFATFDRIGRRLYRHLHADASASLSKRMRLPGSFNWKSGAPVPVVGHIRPGAPLLDLGQVARSLDALGVPDLRQVRSREVIGRRRPVPGVPCSAAAADVAPRVLRAVPAVTRELILHGTSRGRRSEADFHVVRVLLDLGFTEHDVFAVFSSFPDGIGAKSAERGPDYLSLTIESARASLPEAFEVVIERATAGKERLTLVLRMTAGPKIGQRIEAGITLGSAAWEPFLSAVRLGGDVRAVARSSVGKKCRVRLDAHNDVILWLPLA